MCPHRPGTTRPLRLRALALRPIMAIPLGSYRQLSIKPTSRHYLRQDVSSKQRPGRHSKSKEEKQIDQLRPPCPKAPRDFPHALRYRLRLLRPANPRHSHHAHLCRLGFLRDQLGILPSPTLKKSQAHPFPTAVCHLHHSVTDQNRFQSQHHHPSRLVLDLHLMSLYLEKPLAPRWFLDQSPPLQSVLSASYAETSPGLIVLRRSTRPLRFRAMTPFVT